MRISVQPVGITLVQHLLLHLRLQGIEAEKTKSQLFCIFFSQNSSAYTNPSPLFFGLGSYQY